MAATIQTIQKPTRARALDTSGNNNHGQIYSGRALEFDGVNDYLNIGQPSISSTNVTVSAWINIDTNSNYHTILGQSTWNNGIWFAVDNNNKIQCELDGASGDAADYADFISAADTIIPGTWHRVVMAYDSVAGGIIYVNGVSVADTTGETLGEIRHIAEDYRIGLTDAYEFVGKMSDFQIWNATWTVDDVLYDYNNPEQLALNRGGTLLTNSNLKAWYPMNDGHRGQQSYILDASNTGLSDSILSNGDFSNGTTGWSFSDCSGTVGIYFGESNVCKIEVTSEDTVGMYQSNFTTIGQSYKYSFDYYIPSTNTNLDAIQLRASSSSSNKILDSQTVADTWTSVYAYYTPASASVDDVWVYLNSTSTGGNSLTVGNSVYVKNIKIEPVNGKNHATTVFKGDELITVAKDKNMDASNNWDVSSANWSIDGDSLDYDGSGGGNAALDQTYPAFVAGRTYEMKFNTSANDTIITIKDGDGSNTFVAEDTYSSGTKTVTFVAPATTDGLMLTAGGSSAAFAIDWINVKELGTASGWTDADQQLDIPQTALQSYNQLAWFDGTADNVQISDHSDFSFEADVSFSISAWIYMNDSVSYPIVCKDSASHREWALETKTDSKLYFTLWDNSANARQSRLYNTALTSYEGKWIHVVGTYNGDESDADAGINIYINGEIVDDTNDSSGSYTAMEDKSGVVSIGATLSQSKFANGCTTEVSIWSTAFSQENVNLLYNDGKAIDCLQHPVYIANNGFLKGYWRNNGLSTWTNLDNPGTHNGSPTSLTEIMLITAGVDGSKDSQGFLMNRQRLTNSLNYYPDVGGGSNLNIGAQTKVSGSPLTEAQLEAMTVTFWFKSPDNTQTDSLVNVVIDSAAEFIAQTQGNGRLRWTYEIDGFTGSARHKTESGVFSNDKWTFVAFALDHDAGTDANRVLCYVGDEDNAVSLQTNDGTQTGTPTSGMEDDSMWIGGDKASGKKFVGEIDDVCVYSKTLTLAEITRNFNAGKRSHR